MISFERLIQKRRPFALILFQRSIGTTTSGSQIGTVESGAVSVISRATELKWRLIATMRAISVGISRTVIQAPATNLATRTTAHGEAGGDGADAVHQHEAFGAGIL